MKVVVLAQTLLGFGALLAPFVSSTPLDITSADLNSRTPHQRRQTQQDLQAVLWSIPGIANSANDQDRGQFTNPVVNTLRSNNPHYNYVICTGNHDYSFTGSEEVDWGHRRFRWGTRAQNDALRMYDIIVGGAGSFAYYEDPGPRNWAYDGNLTIRSNVGKITFLQFAQP